jgi:O-antigen/teichoic acid export membrane protein
MRPPLRTVRYRQPQDERSSDPVGRVPLTTSLRQRHEPQISRLGGSETAKAVGLAGAMVVNNVIALGSVIVFSRLLTDYGSLAALVSYFLILAVGGYAMQLATAREAVLGHLGVGPAMATTIRAWTRSLLLFTVAMTVVSVLLRHPIAKAVGVKQEWGAALGLPAGSLYLLLCIVRGFLQGLGDYKAVGISLVGEQLARLAIGGVLAAVGFGVTGAYIGTPLSFVVTLLYCGVLLRRHLGGPEPGRRPAVRLWTHVRRAWAAIAALAVIAVLQNIDIIAAKHQFSTDLASSYSAVAVAAKVLIWVAMGAGFYLVPEVSRRHAAGEDTRPVLGKAIAIVAVAAIPCLLIYALVPHLLIKAAFGPKRLLAVDALFILGVAFTVLAGTYLAVQYMLALKRTWFLLPIGAVAVAEPILLLEASKKPVGFAMVVLVVQVVGAVLAFALALRPDRRKSGGGEPEQDLPEPELVGASGLS